MKKMNLKILTSALLLLLSGCNDFLTTELQGVYTNTSFYQTEDHAIFAINSTYEIIAFKNINNNLWVFGDVASDDALKGGNPGDQSDIGFIDEFNITADNGFIESIWKHYYEGVARANKVIYYVPGITMDDELKERIVGEAKFLRAYFYFHLVNIFGSVPLKTEPAFSADDLHVAVSDVATIYQQIEQDLVDASMVLPVSYGSESGRVTSGAALGLYAKTLLFQKKWQESLDAVTQMETLGYTLMPIYRENFEVLTENNSESVFEIQHLTGQVPFLGSSLNQWFSPITENGYFFNAPTQSFVDEFEVTAGGVVDPRLDYTVGRENQKWVNGEDFLPEWSPATGFLNRKHVQPLSEIPKGTKGDGDLNYSFMRYSEIVLMKAEALNELSRGAEALAPLNAIRKRSRESYLFDDQLPGFDGTVPVDLLPDMTSTNQSTLRGAIQHERRVELGFEFHRFYDLMRYGATVAEAALSDTNFNYATHRYFPIPQSEVDTNNSISN
ncbi:MAG: RagB/SusD family nutrient uptake outer membrane protein [Bacteroidetes bacterium]|nr:MAG: RagB/SusD family nutrient uptake outer membrane protein [Bacteroidota bacterium]